MYAAEILPEEEGAITIATTLASVIALSHAVNYQNSEREA